MTSSCATPVGTRVSGCAPPLLVFTPPCLLACLGIACRAWQLYRKIGPRAQRALHANGTAQRADDLADHPEPESEAARTPHLRRALETLEDPVLVLCRDTDSVIAHAEPGQIGRRLDRNGNRLAESILHRVADEIRGDLLQPEPVPASNHGSWRGERRRAPRPGQLFSAVRKQILDERGQIHVLESEIELPSGQP